MMVTIPHNCNAHHRNHKLGLLQIVIEKVRCYDDENVDDDDDDADDDDDNDNDDDDNDNDDDDDEYDDDDDEAIIYTLEHV